MRQILRFLFAWTFVGSGRWKDGDEVIGNETRAKVVVKTRFLPFQIKLIFQILYGMGTDRTAEIIDLGVNYGFVEKSGAWVQLPGDKIDRARPTPRSTWTERPELAREIE